MVLFLCLTDLNLLGFSSMSHFAVEGVYANHLGSYLSTFQPRSLSFLDFLHLNLS